MGGLETHEEGEDKHVLQVSTGHRISSLPQKPDPLNLDAKSALYQLCNLGQTTLIIWASVSSSAVINT